MAENTFGLPLDVYQGLIKDDPLKTLNELETSWVFRPAAYAALFVPGNEQKVVDFLSGNLNDYQQIQVDLGEAMRQNLSPTRELTEYFFELYFDTQVRNRIIEQGNRHIYFFRGADNLSSEEIKVLKYANDKFERRSKQNDLLENYLIYPLIMQSLTVGQRIMMAPGGNIRTLQTMNFAGVM